MELHTIIIGNVKTYKLNSSVPIRVDRTSPLGNPYMMHKEEDRDKVCDKYDYMFWRKIKEYIRFINYFGAGNVNKDDLFINELKYIYYTALNNDVTLLCWCSPLRCHARTIRKFIIMLLMTSEIVGANFDLALMRAVGENAELQNRTV